MPDQQDAAAATLAPDAHANPYQITLAGLVFPLWGHVVFDALAAVCALLMGHPAIAAFMLGACGLADTINQVLVRRWLADSARANAQHGFRKLTLLTSARLTGYMAPVLAMALAGGRAETIYMGVQACSLLTLAMAASPFSRLLFWGFVSPVLTALAILACAKLGPTPAAAVLLSLAVSGLLLSVMSSVTVRAVSTWQAAFAANLAMVAELKAARDQAVEAREEARRANRAKSNFLATMSHEIRTPMNGVLGMAQLLKRDEADPLQDERLDVLIESGEYLLSILNDILDVSKIDAGRLEIVPAPEDLRAFLDGLVGFWGPRADEKGVGLTLRLDDTAPPHVMMDALRVRQVLFNLIGNALKFTDRGWVDISASARPGAQGETLVRFAVRDTGPGIAPDQQPNLFERFSQADESEVRRHGGTGLGLAIAKQLTELMGGRIWVESAPGQGSTFQVEIPLATTAPPARSDAPAVPSPSPEADSASLTVLAVDDNAVNLLVLDQVLTSLGHTVIKAASGPEALEVLAAQPCDLVLMDIHMPGMTGIEALNRLRALAGPNRTTPVIALTADVTSGGRDRYLALGFNEHNAKPIQIQELAQTMARAVGAPRRRKRNAS